MPVFPPIRKAVFPVAGLGTRFLPATKSIPKEMLPIVDKPLIQYAVEEDVGKSVIRGIVEKPAPEVAPSNLGVVGRYILPPEIFPLLEAVRAGVGGEIQLTDAIAALLETRPLMAFAFEGLRYDCGSRQGFVHATLDYALSDAGLSENMLAQIRKLGRD